jgi:homoserine dehydrogenase
MKTINVGLVGLGTVGQGVVRILQEHREDFSRDQEVDLKLVAVSSRHDSAAKELGLMDIYSPDISSVTESPYVDIVIELIGGTDVAHQVVESALLTGKSVVTANKALIATSGRELMRLAVKQGVEIAFEASVGGGIPIITPLRHTLASNRIQSVLGIVNGTTNYMLTRMASDGSDYDEVLKEAQELGYAEADPSADVEGYDAAAKAAILAMIAYNTDVRLDQVPTEGITKLTAQDHAAASEAGYVIKLLAIAQRAGEGADKGIDIRVHPTLLVKDHALASVQGVFNAIYVVGDSVGETMFYGRGAGSGPAASSVVGDLIELARHIAFREKVAQPVWDTENLPVLGLDAVCSEFYMRLTVADKHGVLAAVARVFADQGISIASMTQSSANAGKAELTFFTHDVAETAVRAAIQSLQAEELVIGEPLILHIL